MAANLLHRSGAAGRWLAVVMLVDGLSAGCLLPQDLSEIPDPVNLPPTFEFADARPTSPVTCLSDDPESTPVTFTLGPISDPNGVDDQRLAARWFFDYDPDDALSREPLKREFLAVQQPGTGSTIYGLVEFDARLLDNLSFAPGAHVLEVVISDGFAPEETDETRRKPAAGRYAVSKAWTIRYTGDVPCEGAN